MVYQHTEKDFVEVGYAPYSMPLDVEFRFISRSDPAFDYWAVGVVILEVLLGSEFVITTKD